MQPDLNSNPPRDHVSRLDAPGYKLSIGIRDKLTSGNVMLRWHWRKRNAHQKRVIRDIGWLVTGSHLPDTPLLRSKVELMASLPRLMDLDNLYTGAKPYIDALTRNNIIADDAVRYINLEVNQRRSSKPYVLITVTALA